MASGRSKYLEEKNLLHNLGITAFTMPATVAVALVTATPTSAMTGATITEATYTGYARLVLSKEAAETLLSGENPMVAKNKSVLKWAECTAGSSKVVGIAICDSATTGAGNMLYYATVTEFEVSTAEGHKVPEVAAEALEIKSK